MAHFVRVGVRCRSSLTLRVEACVEMQAARQRSHSAVGPTARPGLLLEGGGQILVRPCGSKAPFAGKLTNLQFGSMTCALADCINAELSHLVAIFRRRLLVAGGGLIRQAATFCSAALDKRAAPPAAACHWPGAWAPCGQVQRHLGTLWAGALVQRVRRSWQCRPPFLPSPAAAWEEGS